MRVTIHRARRLHKPKYPKLTTYVRVSIAGRSEYRYTREVKSNENPIYGGKAEGQTLPALPIGPGGMDGKLLHVVVFATSSFGGDEAIGELRDIVTKLQQPDVSIDWLTTAVQRASVLLAYCNSHLHATEGEVAELIKQLGIETEN